MSAWNVSFHDLRHDWRRADWLERTVMVLIGMFLCGFLSAAGFGLYALATL